MSPETDFKEQITKTKTTTIRVCDSCMYREYDEDGKRIQSHGTWINLCSYCLGELRENAGGEPEHVLRKREWLDSMFDESSVRGHIYATGLSFAAVVAVSILFTTAAYGVSIPRLLLIAVLSFPGVLSLAELLDEVL